MKAAPLVSVIVPAYNAEAYIRQALESALGQTYEHLEVLVIDDGSGDGTAEIVREVAAEDGRVRLFQQANGGVASARNHGIKHARGTYIAPLDADDPFYPRKLEAQVARMEAGGEGMGMVYCWWISMDQSGRVFGGASPWRIEGDVYERLLYVNFIGNASVPLYRRSALEQVGSYDESLRARGGQGCEDWELSLRVAEQYEVGLAPGYHSGYRGVAGGMSASCESMAASYRLVVGDIRRRRPDLPHHLFRWSGGNFYSYLAGTAYGGGRRAEALKWIKEAVKADLWLLLAPHTVRTTLGSLGWIVLHPLATRLWPTHRDWIAFKRRVGLPTLKLTTRDAVEAEAVPVDTPWVARGTFDQIRARRWESLSRKRAAEPASSPVETMPRET
jgi:glycosyltransferase involved in cell wall biosynthesis